MINSGKNHKLFMFFPFVFLFFLLIIKNTLKIKIKKYHYGQMF